MHVAEQTQRGDPEQRLATIGGAGEEDGALSGQERKVAGDLRDTGALEDSQPDRRVRRVRHLEIAARPVRRHRFDRREQR